MRYLFLVSLLIIWIQPITAQATLVCDSAEQLFSQVRIQPPEIPENSANEYIVTVVGIDDYDPVVGITLPPFEDAEPDERNILLCNAEDSRAAQYSAMLPTTGEVPPSEISAQELVLDEGQNFIDVGEFDGAGGEFLVIIEGRFDLDFNPDADTFTFSIPQNLIDAEIPLTAYAFGLTEGYTPALTINTGGASITTQPIEAARLVTDFTESTTGVQAALPRSLTDVSLTINGAAESEYALVLHLGSTPSVPPSDTAVVTRTPDGLRVLRCGGSEVFQNGLAFNLPPTGDYTVTALGNDNYTPVLALVDDTNEGTCFEATNAARNYRVDLPSIVIDGSLHHAQAQVNSTQRTVVVGSRGNFAGEFVLMIEGGNLSAEAPTQNFGLIVSPGLAETNTPLRAYAIASVLELDTIITLTDEAGTALNDANGKIVQCDNAGVSATCYGDTVLLRDALLRFGEDNLLAGFELDSMLVVPPELQVQDQVLQVQVAGTATGAIGAYILALHVTTD